MQCNNFDNISVTSQDFCINTKETATLHHSDICFTAELIKLFLSSSTTCVTLYCNFYLQCHFQHLSFLQRFGIIM